MLNGHLDAVSLADCDCDCDPLDPQIRDGRMYGRGTFDMKGGLAAIMVAAARATARGPLPGDVLLACVADEEHGSAGTEEVLEPFTSPARCRITLERRTLTRHRAGPRPPVRGPRRALLFGVDGDGAHAATEWADRASLDHLTDILTAPLTDFCSSAVGRTRRDAGPLRNERCITMTTQADDHHGGGRTAPASPASGRA